MTFTLERRVGLAGATALNIIEMIGVGPFVTIPLIIHAMGGPQAVLGWLFGALFALCDGMVWAELGASYPRAGGSYEYLKEIFGPRWGRTMAFLYVWQTSFSAPMSIASGCVGLAQYATYVVPSLSGVFVTRALSVRLPLVGTFRLEWSFGWPSILAMLTCLVALYVCYRAIANVAAIAKFLAVGVLGTAGWVVFAGATHFHSNLALDIPPGAFTLNHSFFTGLGAAILIATYDYWGYYNVNFFGSEVLEPERNIPRALALSICIVAVLYLVMNVCILGVVPWRELDRNSSFTISLMMQSIYGSYAGKIAALLVMWTAFASVISVMTGIARVGYAAALDGNYFPRFAHLHPTRRFPDTSLLALGVVALLFCTLRLQDLIAGLVIVRLIIQFLAQAIGLIVLRKRQPNAPRPYRMPLFPMPAIVAVLGFTFVLFSRPNAARELVLAAVIAITGVLIYRFVIRPRGALSS